MLSRPSAISDDDLAAVLAKEWGIKPGSLEYRPVGFGSHHWRAGGDWFVTVDEVGELSDADALAAALGTAQDLRAGGLSFVVAPVPTGDGSPLARLHERFAVAVYPYVEGQSFDWDDWSSPEHHRAVLDLVVTLHTTTIPTRARADELGIPHRAAVTAPDGSEHGPYSRRAGHLLAGHQTAIRRRLADYDALVHTRPSTVVVTHGEPHPGNTMLTTDGWRLIDWDTVRLAPPERDLWSLGKDDEYAEATGYRPDPKLIELFRLRWDLADLAVTAERFRHPHAGDADDDESWEILETLVESLSAGRGVGRSGGL